MDRKPAKPKTRQGRSARKGKPAGATEEIERTNPAREPLPDPTGLTRTLSPVDLPEPAAPLPHPLRWTSRVIAVATLTLFLLNAHALRSWSYQLAPNDASARVVTFAESWYDLAGRAGLNRPVETMHAWWQSAKNLRFGGQAAKPAEEDPKKDA